MAKAREDWMQNVAGSMDDTVRVDVPASASAAEKQREGRRRLETGALIRVDRITRDPNQPRTEDDAEGRYVIVTGERRWRAAQLAGLEALTCVVMTGPAEAEDLLEAIPSNG